MSLRRQEKEALAKGRLCGAHRRWPRILHCDRVAEGVLGRIRHCVAQQTQVRRLAGDCLNVDLVHVENNRR
eukprot:1886486-Pleurochrysis_carterae.AAC.1